MLAIFHSIRPLLIAAAICLLFFIWQAGCSPVWRLLPCVFSRGISRLFYTGCWDSNL